MNLFLTKTHFKWIASMLILTFLVQEGIAQPWFTEFKQTNRTFAAGRQNAEGYFAKVGQHRTGFKAFKRWENYWKMRARQDGAFPPSNVRQAEWDAYQAQAISNVPGPGGSDWTSLGPSSSDGGYAGIGRINRVVYHPTDANTVFACTAGGGVWKTTNAGTSWINLTANLVRLGTSDLLVDRTNSNTLYLATGDCDAGDTPSIGILKSTDGGTTWNTTGLTFTDNQYKNIYKIVQHSSNASIFLAATSDGIYRSTNAGQTWSLVLTNTICHDLEKKTNASTTFFATGYNRTTGQQQLLISTDDGASWIVRTSFSGAYRAAIAVTPANPNYVGVIVSNSSSSAFYGYYSSTDGGLNYTVQSTSPNLLGWEVNGSDNSGQGWYDLCIAISPTNANQVFVGGVNNWKSSDGGRTWTLGTHWAGAGNYPEVHADHHDISFQNNTTLYLACDGGIYKSTNSGTSWADISNGITISQIYRIGVSQTDTKTIAGLQDNGTKLRGTTGTWLDVIGGDGMDCAIDPTNSNVMYGEVYYGDLYRTINGWGTSTNISPVANAGAWISPLVIDPSSSQTLYFGTNRTLYKSTNRGTSWTAIASNLTNGEHVNYIAVAPSNSSNILFTSEINEIFKTTNGGSSWTKLTAPLGNGNNVTSITFHPTDPNTIFVTYSNYTAGSKVFRSTNGGSTWTNITGTLPNLPANCLVYQKGSNGGLYLGMDVGIYYRDNTMSDWMLFSSGLPNAEIFDLEIRYNTGKIVAGTYGRGLWESPLYVGQANSLTVSPGTQSAPATAGNFAITVTSNVSWTATSNATWLTVSPASGSNNGTITATYAANTGAARTGTVTFTGGGITQIVTVTQAAVSSLTVSPSTQSAPATTGTFAITVTSNISWTATSNASWLTFSPASGSNNGTVTATYAANTAASRTGVITISGGGISRTVTVTQAAAPSSLTVSPSTQSVQGTTGNFAITVTSNVSWTASSNATWLTVSPASGSNNGIVTATYAANTGASRSGVITINGGGISRTVTVTQAAAPALTVSPSTQSAPATTGNFAITITSNVNWTASSNATWLTVSPASGSNNGTVTATYAANTGASRSGVITINGGGISRTVTVTQAAVAPSLTVSPTTQSVIATAGDFAVTVTSNVSWTASANVPWLSISPTSGTNNGTITATYSANNGSARSGVITITGGSISRTVTVTQAASSLTVSPSTQSAPATTGNFAITVTSNVNWTASSNATWLTISPASGSNNGTITATYAANSGVSRSGIVTISGGGINRTVTVTQSAFASTLYVGPATKITSATTDTVQFRVQSNIAWTISNPQNWLITSTESGSNNATVVVYLQDNLSNSNKTGTLIFTGSNITRTVSIVQTASPTGSTLSVTPTTVNASNLANTVNIQIATASCWTVAENASWILPGAAEGLSNSTLKLFLQENKGVARSAVVSINSAGSTVNVTVNQAAGTGSLIEPTLDGWIEIQEELKPKAPSMKLYPNPANDVVNIEIELGDHSLEGAELWVIDALGRIVLKQKCTQMTEMVNLNTFTNGMYLFQLKLDDATKLIQKLVVNNR